MDKSIWTPKTFFCQVCIGLKFFIIVDFFGPSRYECYQPTSTPWTGVSLSCPLLRMGEGTAWASVPWHHPQWMGGCSHLDVGGRIAPTIVCPTLPINHPWQIDNWKTSKESKTIKYKSTTNWETKKKLKIKNVTDLTSKQTLQRTTSMNVHGSLCKPMAIHASRRKRKSGGGHGGKREGER